MRFYDIHDAYLLTLGHVWHNYTFKSAPRDMPIRELMNHTFEVMNPSSEPIRTRSKSRNQVIKEYTEREFALYNSGTNLVEDFAKASKFWNKISNPDGTVNSAYGHLIWHNESMGSHKFNLTQTGPDWAVKLGFATKEPDLVTPWQWCADSLKVDKDTRQAIMKFMLPEHLFKGNKDVTCTTHGIWHIRNNRLYLSIVMRANDVVKGLAFDLPWFCSLMDKMLEELKPTYPELTKGTYTHTVHSIHAYESDEKVIMEMLGR